MGSLETKISLCGRTSAVQTNVRSGHFRLLPGILVYSLAGQENLLDLLTRKT